MDYLAWGNLADAYYYSDTLKPAAEVVYKKAIEIGEERLRVNPSDMETTADVAFFYARIGHEVKAREMSAAAMTAAPDHMYVHYYGALLYAHIGDVEQALNALERAVELDYQRELLQIDPGLKPLWEEARFKRLVAKSGL
jgi:tetratricopeptide (TPR) repeat protein